jgi:hypothetical protein
MTDTSYTVADESPDSLDFMAEARQRFQWAFQSDKEDREKAVEDTTFAAGNGKQWDSAARAARIAARRPVLEWNRLTGFIAQVVNDGRENKPSVKVSAMDGGKTETADFYQSRIRHIEYESDADIAYDTSREQQVTCGRGFYRITTKYLPKSMEQELRVERIENQFSCLCDPAAREYDRSDADWWFVISQISKDEYKRRYGKKRNIVRSNWYSDSNNPATDWVGVGSSGELVQIAEYWLKKHKKRTLIQLLSGQMVWEDESSAAAVFAQDENGDPISRDCDDITICQYIIDGVEILDETDWLGTLIPIIPLWGKELVVEGKRQTFSLIRPAKDPQRLVNLYVSNIAEQIAMMPKTPYIVAEGQITNNLIEEWENINSSPRAYVQYKQVAIGGTLAPAPSRVINEPPIQALTIGLNQALDAIKAACNIYDPSLGAKSNETSGIAIQRRQRESDVANFHFHDNEARSRKYAGRILLELIPKIDKGMRSVATRSEDGKTKVVPINQEYTDEETGETQTHDLTAGSEAYTLAVATGPSYTSQRQESFDTWSQVAQADKNFMSIAGDLMFRTSDAPMAEQIADRYEKALPPQLQDAKPGQQQIPPQVQQMIQAMSQQHEQLTQTVHTLTDEIMAQKTQTDSRERIVALQEETKLSLGLAALNSKEGLALLEQEISALHKKYDQVHEAMLAGNQQRHEQRLQASAQGHQAGMQANAQDHSAEMQEGQQDHAAGMQDTQNEATADQAAEAAKTQKPKAA